ncbi:hypothetical protein CFC21_027141 [Triticum aestivum]|uniref:Uncharacterized protein n=5 Tax=Triticinae TaxID=1648030 RepID=A0A453A8U9_AEGTS|nr:uncharacterized protein LOC109772679 [Aegilops tauschii subsp. strangulata]XP_044329690.1 uncharacterized protein LOC123051020 [Triticum aestivum]KAF7013012.1 hypothetical protein CFC21_027141 [Triticum aestivum]
MEVAISAVAGELVSRFISFLMNKYCSNHQRSEEKLAERLQHLLMRVGTVVEEADARYIVNCGMITQLKMLSEAMYRGHRVVDTLRYKTHQESEGFNEVSINDSSSSLYLAIRFKRSRTATEKEDKAMRLESHDALESLEIAVANMAEFVVLLGGCERMSRRPYDIYLYTDNFMFGRQAEKQKLLSFLLHHNPPGDAPAVLPIIGGVRVGKKTLVAHVCGDERVRSCFSSVLHLNGDSLLRVFDHGSTTFGVKMLVVIEFDSDVCDDDWKVFHSFAIRMCRGSKIIILSRIQRLARFGSVKPILLSVLSYDELSYLFKKMAFGSVDPAEHPRLVQIADEVTKELHKQGSLIAANAYAGVLRRNLDVQFWRCILDKGTRYTKRNLFLHGAHPSMLIEQGHPMDITDIALHPLSMTPYTSNVPIKEESPSVTLAELLADPSVRPEGDFNLIVCESRIPPHESFVHFVTSHAQDAHEVGALPGRKRRGVPI